MKKTRIPYSQPMARARRDGIKTHTRREMRPQPTSFVGGPGVTLPDGSPAPKVPMDDYWGTCGREIICPYGQPGDILLPVEPWRAPKEFDALPPSHIPTGTPIWLDANGPAPEAFGRYRHARFMPRHLITASDVLVAVRVERLQDISEADAVAEGCKPKHLHGHMWATAYMAYGELWESINGPGTWDANPCVWVLEFKVLTP